MVEVHVFDYLVGLLTDYVAKMKGLYELTSEETIFMLDVVKFSFLPDKVLEMELEERVHYLEKVKRQLAEKFGRERSSKQARNAPTR